MLEKDNLKGIVENHLVCGLCLVDDADEKVFTFADLLRTKLPEEYHELIDGVVTDYRKQKTKDGNKVDLSYSHVGCSTSATVCCTIGHKKIAGRQGKWTEKKRRKCLQKS
jgi:hypothetical protein